MVSKADSKELWLKVHESIPKRALTLGTATSNAYFSDPKMLAFIASRYKFASKMLEGKSSVLEIGCGDAFGAPIVAAAVGRLTGTDIHPETLEDCATRLKGIENLNFEYFDFRSQSRFERVDAIFSVDVWEHIFPEEESQFLGNVLNSLKPDGILLTGTPNVYAEQYASEYSRLAHVNLKSADSLRTLMLSKFQHCFMFCMNDEIVHTGFAKMSHYIWSLAVGPK
jgi:cyclopropane fatty-acyl-phospholipid synthase-like methyltransferase